MGIIFDFGDEPKKMQPDTRIVFSKLDSKSMLSPPDWRGLSTEDRLPSPAI
jgi:hypothetical protein